MKKMNKNKNSYKFFEDLIYDITDDYRQNEGKQYDIEKTIENLYGDDDLWQQLNDSVWNNLVEIEDKYTSLKNNLEKGLLDEIDMCCGCSFDEEIELTNEQKVKIVKEMINSEDYLWQMITDRVMDYIRDEIKEGK